MDNRFINTGLNGYDRLLGGLKMGEFVVVAARPAIGKTALLMNLLVNILSDHTCAYLSCRDKILEDYDAYDKLVRLISHLNVDDELKGKKFLQGERYLKNLLMENKFIFFDNFTTLPELISEIRLIKQTSKMSVLFIDNILLSQLTIRHKMVKMQMSKLKQLAEELNIAVVVSTCLSRMNQIHFGFRQLNGELKAVADKIVFIDRPALYAVESQISNGSVQKDEFDLHVFNGKKVKIGAIRLNFNNRSLKITDTV